MAKRFLRRRQVEEKTGLFTSTLYEHLARGTFPKPVHISPRVVVWLEAEVDGWMAAHVAQRDGQEAA